MYGSHLPPSGLDLALFTQAWVELDTPFTWAAKEDSESPKKNHDPINTHVSE